MHRLSTTSSRSLRRAATRAANKVSAPSLTRGAHKDIKFSNEGRASILKGVDILANAVSVTLGPKGKVSLLPCCIVHLLTCLAQDATSSSNSLMADLE